MRLILARIAGLAAWLGLLLTLGCGEEPPPLVEPAVAPVAVGERFDASTAGSIQGKVVWSGDVPEVPPFEVRSWVLDPKLAQPRPFHANPHAPVIDPDSHGVGGAIIFLQAVDAQSSRPWDHPAVVIEFRDRQLEVVQGGRRSHVGFLRRGEALTMVSREKVFNALRASGAAFFALAFPDPDQPLTRVFRDKGLVDLSSNAGWYWMHAHLFVVDHPYYTRTDAKGNFELRRVPPGRFQIVCWMPNWNKAHQDRDPESGLVTRLAFQPPLEQKRDIVVDAGASVSVDFTIRADLFKR